MKIEFIYTFNSGGQFTAEVSPIEKESLESKEKVYDLAIGGVPEKMKHDLCKISIAVYLADGEDVEAPVWLMQCNGKLFIKDGELTE